MMAHSGRIKDLHRALYEHPDELLRGIASVWRVSLADVSKEAWARQLAEAMQSPDRLGTVVEHLSDEARALLAEIASQGGLLPVHRLVMGYGSLRRLGPAALRREAPWESPQNAVEELFFRGLAYRAYADLEGKPVEALYIPEPLLTLVRDLSLERRRVTLETLAQNPSVILSDDRASAQEDLLALLVHLRNHAPRLPADGDLRTLLVDTLESLRERGRLLGEGSEQRLSFLAALAASADLVNQRGALVAPSPKARAWLHANEADRYRFLFQAWRRDATWDELDCAGLTILGDHIGYDIVGARNVVLSLIARAPMDTWLSLSSLVHVIKRSRPDLLRPDGDYDAWQLRDQKSGQLVSGYEQWDRIEGTVVVAMVTGPLYWLGLVRLGSDDDGVVSSFYLPSERAARWSRRETPTTDNNVPVLRAEVTEDGGVRILVRETCYTRYQLERFARWEEQNDIAAYRITEASVAAGYRSGVRTAHMIPFLQRISGDGVPQPLLARLLVWGGRFGRVWARKAIVLETVDKATMRELRSDPDIKPYLDVLVDGTRHLVRERDAEELFQRLRARGIWVQMIENGD